MSCDDLESHVCSSLCGSGAAELAAPSSLVGDVATRLHQPPPVIPPVGCLVARESSDCTAVLTVV